MERWAGRVAVVTGASSGIGAALARELTKHGMKVAALARRVDKLQKLETDCQHLKGLLKVYKCDVSVESEIAKTVNDIVADVGPISVLINNAGALNLIKLTETTGSPRNVFETNVIGTVVMTQQTVEIMKKFNITDGHIININSTVGHSIFPMTGMGIYGASKTAITVLTESLKNELSELNLDTRVTSISPGFVKTEMSEGFSKENLPKLQTDDIVECIIFVLSLKQNINISEMTIQPTKESIPRMMK